MIFGRIFQVTASFRDFNLPESFLAALDQRGFTEPTPVQAQVLSQPDLSRDMVVQARTGSGKTLGFLLPILSEREGGNKNPRVLVLSPTRELAMQNANESEFFGKIKGIGTAAIVGGMSMEHQIFKLKHGTTVVVGTPGRVLDHVRRGTLDLSEIETVVLDEGDSMMDMGFREELEAILDAATSRKRTWLFSATMPEAVFSLAQRYLNDPLRLELNHDEEQHADIVHRAYL
ncbi:MAG: DEAD/DEAH box helicase, partial [Pyramidobacter sp.]|nr:DEAD/DEAH box helicase [Pyramidobacter sp.]